MLKSTQKQIQVQKPMPVLVQKQNILMLPTLAFEQMIKQELETNPFLEEVTDSDNEMETETDTADEMSEEMESEESAEISQDDEFDYEDLSNEDLEGYKTGNVDEVNKRLVFENIWSASDSMRDNLTQQLLLFNLSDKEYFIGEELINLIDSEGYIRQSNAELLAEINELKNDTEFENEEFTEEEIEKVLGYVQKLDPPGIGARNLFECLIRQIEMSEADEDFKNLCIKILKDYSEDLRLKRYEKLIKELGIDNEVINKVFEFISKLNPKPGVVFKDSAEEYIYPDFIVEKVDGKWKAELTEKNYPRIRLNNEYMNLIKKDRRNVKPEFKNFVKDNYEKAKWFLDSINSRRETMMLVMNYILEKQKSFFDTAGKQLVPMYERELAESIGRDISTISRTVRGKYVQTDFGIFELKHFFSNSMKSQAGEDVSTKEIKAKMQSIIEQENPMNPYTDDELEAELKKAGYNISRRTVAKYREAMKIPKARLRRKI
jgi:RNA polymerase sigma-54 factor